MKQIKGIVTFLALLFCSNYFYAQNTLTGKVVDSKTKTSLAFVNIIVNNNPRIGTVSDIDGKFTLNTRANIKNITFSYVGYKRSIINTDSISLKSPLIVELTATSIKLQEVIVKAGENPAHRIIRKAIENKDLNNPENVSSFKYTSYNKSIYNFKLNDSLKTDTMQMKLDSLLRGGYLLLMESVTERKFIAPDLSEEIIIGNRVSGFKHPSFAALATDIQPFSFYEDLIPILDINYLNPISKGSLNKYNFYIEDTLYPGVDTTFIISFQPQKNKNFEALKGLLYINTHKFAIQNVIAEPYEKGFIDIKIEQKYQLINQEHWFPEQLNFEMVLSKYPSEKLGMLVNGRSYVKDVELMVNLHSKDFSIDAIKMHDNATEKDSLFWQQHRVEKLNIAEEKTYHFIDSLGEEHNFDGLMNLMEKMVVGRIPIGPIDLDLTETLLYNDFEGYRWGFGAYTNEKVSKVISVGGFFGYGDKDHQWKYGGEFILSLNKNRELEINGKHQNTLKEPGRSELIYFNRNAYDVRSYLAYRMDRILQNSLSIGIRTLRYAKINATVAHTVLKPQYNYNFQSELIENPMHFRYGEFKMNIRYAYREKLVQSLRQRISMGTEYPVLSLSYSKGIKGFYGSEFEFNKIEGRLEKSFLSKNIGETKIRIDAGILDRSLPYPLLFTGEGSFDEDLIIHVPNYFQTVTPYEFLSDRYVNLFLSHSFESLLLQIGNFKPRFTIHQNMGWGELSNKENHQMLEFNTKEKGLLETGLQIDNILKMNYVNIGYLGFGVGAFYRYGAYSHSTLEDNIAIKLSMTLSSK